MGCGTSRDVVVVDHGPQRDNLTDVVPGNATHSSSLAPEPTPTTHRRPSLWASLVLNHDSSGGPVSLRKVSASPQTLGILEEGPVPSSPRQPHTPTNQDVNSTIFPFTRVSTAPTGLSGMFLLPAEVLRRLFDFLMPTEIMCLGSTCRDLWAACGENSQIWEDIYRRLVYIRDADVEPDPWRSSWRLACLLVEHNIPELFLRTPLASRRFEHALTWAVINDLPDIVHVLVLVSRVLPPEPERTHAAPQNSASLTQLAGSIPQLSISVTPAEEDGASRKETPNPPIAIEAKRSTSNKKLAKRAQSRRGTARGLRYAQEDDGFEPRPERPTNSETLHNQAQVDGAMITAAKHGSVKATRALLKIGANPNGPEQQKDVYEAFTPLHVSLDEGHTAVAIALLHSFPKVDLTIARPSDHLLPLHVAAMKGYGDVVNMMTERPVVDEFKGTRRPAMCKIDDLPHSPLYSEEATFDDRFLNESVSTALMGAVMTGNVNTARVLIKNGANVNIPRHDGLTPIYVAAFMHNYEMMEMLLDHSARLDAGAGSGTWWTEMALAIEDSAEKKKNDAYAEACFKSAFDASKLDMVSSTPLFAGVQNNYFFKELTGHMHQHVFFAGENIVKAGDMGSSMFFITRGTCGVIVGNNKRVAEMTKGQFFGEVSIFSRELGIPGTRTATIRAEGEEGVEVFELIDKDLDNTLEIYPEYKESIISVARARLEGDRKKKEQAAAEAAKAQLEAAAAEAAARGPNESATAEPSAIESKDGSTGSLNSRAAPPR